MVNGRFSATMLLQITSLALVTSVVHAYNQEFQIYWNIPTFMCHRYNITVPNLPQQYGIIQNLNDEFRGDQIAILYDPGKFPAILQDSSTKKFYYRNRGVPQEGNLHEHLQLFEDHVNELIPDKNFSGIAIIDFESWRPIYRQNFGTLQPYKNLSVYIERQKHKWWTDRRTEREAARRFEEAAREFMEQTLWLAQKLRPKASWGYYAFPYCFNGRGTAIESCFEYIQRENNGILWLFESSDAVFPSVYMNEGIQPKNRIPMVRGRIAEARRLSNLVAEEPRPRVFVYYRYVFTDTLRYISEAETYGILHAIKSAGADGVILWGSSNDLKTKKMCEEFYGYVINTLGPVVQSLQPTYYVNSIYTNNN